MNTDIYTAEGYRQLSELWVKSGWQQKISYEPTWMGVRIVQLPEDILMMQELIWKVRPDVIVETGTAHGGSAVFYASMLRMASGGSVISVDIDIRSHNREVIENHPMAPYIKLVEGSSVEEDTVERVRELIPAGAKVLVVLDSNHTYAHVLREMELYGPLASQGSYMVVFDGIMESLADAPNGSPEWETDNPRRSIREFLSLHDEYAVDAHYNRMGVTYAPGGFLRRIR